jgi:type IV secretion system protein VirD4
MKAPVRAKKQNKPSFLGFLFFVFGIIGLNCAVTQYLAAQFAYQAALGKPLLLHVYNPFVWILWRFQFYNQAKPIFTTCDMAALIGFLVIIFITILIQGFSNRKTQAHDDLHGTAHWASPKEVRKTGLLPDKSKAGGGVYVGGWQDDKGTIHYLRHNGPEHIAAIAPTRSGKGVGLVIPTLLSWTHSAVIHDMKGELWALTAGWRQQQANNKVLKFDPASLTGGCHFNPLAEVRLTTPYEVADVQNLVTIIVDPDGKGLESHWDKTAHEFLTGVTLHLLYINHNEGKTPATLKDVAMALSNPKSPIDELYKAMLTTIHRVNKNETHEVVASAARAMLDRDTPERTSVLSSAKIYLSIYSDPLVAENTKESHFRIADLMKYEQPVSLYLVVRPADKDRLKPLMRLILNQIIRTLTRDELVFTNGQAEKNYKHRLLLMLDEFPSFGRLEVFQEALAFIAGYGIKAYLIMQDISQLYAAYTQYESILSNCHVRVAYAPNKNDTAEWLSKTTGISTVVVEEISQSGHRFGMVLENVNQSFNSVSRPLLTPDECLTLPSPEKNEMTGEIISAGAMLIFVAGSAPIYGTQILYFIDPTFSQRVSIPAPTQSDILEIKFDEEEKKETEEKLKPASLLPEPLQGAYSFFENMINGLSALKAKVTGD